MKTEDKSASDVAGPLFTERLCAASDRPKWIIYDRSESMVQSLASDVATLGGLLACIWFSQRMGGGVWEFVTLVMFTLWSMCRMPWERATRTTKLRTKAEAKAWAESLQDDAPSARLSG